MEIQILGIATSFIEILYGDDVEVEMRNGDVKYINGESVLCQ
jgi:hypothetical protein